MTEFFVGGEALSAEKLNRAINERQTKFENEEASYRVAIAVMSDDDPEVLAITGFKGYGDNDEVPKNVSNPHNVLVADGDVLLLGEGFGEWVILRVLSDADVKVSLDDEDTNGYLLAKLGFNSTTTTPPSYYQAVIAVRNPAGAGSVTLYAPTGVSGGGDDHPHIIAEAGQEITDEDGYASIGRIRAVIGTATASVTTATNYFGISCQAGDALMLVPGSQYVSWSINTVYSAGDVVIYADSIGITYLYRRNTAGSSGATFNAPDWTAVQLLSANVFVEGFSYASGDIVQMPIPAGSTDFFWTVDQSGSWVTWSAAVSSGNWTQGAEPPIVGDGAWHIVGSLELREPEDLADLNTDEAVQLDNGDSAGHLLNKLNLSTVLTAPADHIPVIALRNPFDSETITLLAPDTPAPDFPVIRTSLVTISGSLGLDVSDTVASVSGWQAVVGVVGSGATASNPSGLSGEVGDQFFVTFDGSTWNFSAKLDAIVALDSTSKPNYLLSVLGLATVTAAPADHFPVVAVRDPVDADSITLYAENTEGSPTSIDPIRAGVATITHTSLLSVSGFRTSGTNPTVTTVTNPHSVNLSVNDEVLLGENGSDWEIITVLGGGGSGVDILHGKVTGTIAGAAGFDVNGDYVPTTTGTIIPMDDTVSPWTQGTAITSIEWAGEGAISGSTLEPILVKYHWRGAIAVIDSQDSCCGE